MNTLPPEYNRALPRPVLGRQSTRLLESYVHNTGKPQLPEHVFPDSALDLAERIDLGQLMESRIYGSYIVGALVNSFRSLCLYDVPDQEEMLFFNEVNDIVKHHLPADLISDCMRHVRINGETIRSLRHAHAQSAQTIQDRLLQLP